MNKQEARKILSEEAFDTMAEIMKDDTELFEEMQEYALKTAVKLLNLFAGKDTDVLEEAKEAGNNIQIKIFKAINKQLSLEDTIKLAVLSSLNENQATPMGGLIKFLEQYFKEKGEQE